MSRIKHPEWLDSLEPTPYPFEDAATLANAEGQTLYPGTFLDAVFYPVGGSSGGYLSQVDIDDQTAVLHYSDDVNLSLATATISLAAPAESIRFTDSQGRPAGLMVSEPIRLAIFQSWPDGSHEFLPEQTRFVASACMPVPDVGVRGIMADDGNVVTGDVYLVGDGGVVLSCESVSIDGTCGEPTQELRKLRVDVVGDPLWRRRKCAPGFFATPRFLKTITFQRGRRSLTCGPGDNGNIRVLVGDDDASDTILRVRPTTGGLIMEAVGERLEDIRST